MIYYRNYYTYFINYIQYFIYNTLGYIIEIIIHILFQYFINYIYNNL